MSQLVKKGDFNYLSKTENWMEVSLFKGKYSDSSCTLCVKVELRRDVSMAK